MRGEGSVDCRFGVDVAAGGESLEEEKNGYLGALKAKSGRIGLLYRPAIACSG
jgi:hypothetical protein